MSGLIAWRAWVTEFPLRAREMALGLEICMGTVYEPRYQIHMDSCTEITKLASEKHCKGEKFCRVCTVNCPGASYVLIVLFFFSFLFKKKKK